jgi:hypothetical protein
MIVTCGRNIVVQLKLLEDVFNNSSWWELLLDEADTLSGPVNLTLSELQLKQLIQELMQVRFDCAEDIKRLFTTE